LSAFRAQTPRRFPATSCHFGGAFNAHVHFHCCVIDGVFTASLVPLSTLRAGHRLALHGLASEVLHTFLVRQKLAAAA